MLGLDIGSGGETNCLWSCHVPASVSLLALLRLQGQPYYFPREETANEQRNCLHKCRIS